MTHITLLVPSRPASKEAFPRNTIAQAVRCGDRIHITCVPPAGRIDGYSTTFSYDTPDDAAAAWCGVADPLSAAPAVFHTWTVPGSTPPCEVFLNVKAATPPLIFGPTDHKFWRELYKAVSTKRAVFGLPPVSPKFA